MSSTGATFAEHVKEFDRYVSKNYSQLRITAEQICWNHPEFEDILQNNLIKVRERITKSGWTNTVYSSSGYDRSVYAYLWRGIQNDYRLKKKRENRRQTVDFNNELLEQEINQTLFGMEHDSQPYHNSLDAFARLLFEYVEIKYTLIQSSIFKLYALSNGSDRTFKNVTKKIGGKTGGYTIKFVRKTIQTIKKDLRGNLANYIEQRLKERNERNRN